MKPRTPTGEFVVKSVRSVKAKSAVRSPSVATAEARPQRFLVQALPLRSSKTAR
jgi:hypothetical protein